jgi:hypothetical protein
MRSTNLVEPVLGWTFLTRDVVAQAKAQTLLLAGSGRTLLLRARCVAYLA